MKNKGSDSINIITLGCSKNTVDSEFLMWQLTYGHVKVLHNAPFDAAPILIINTCGFIKDAKEESIDVILQGVQAKKEGKINSLVVMGCLSERYKKELEHEIPEVDKYFGVNDLKQITESFGINYKKELTGERLLSTPKHYAYLKISEGCDRSCSFCAIPMIRGKHRSKSMDDLLKEARYLGEAGVKELILIAQDLTYYGIDIYRKQMLPELVQRLSDLPFFRWIRLHYAYPASFPRKLVAVMKERENICNYLDIPVQHISDKVLKNMRRNHDSLKTREIINFIRGELPYVTLRTTLLVGHPGEGIKEFRELEEFVLQSRFERLGVFTYSEEEGTYAAAHFKDSLSGPTKTKRMEKIMGIQQQIAFELNKLKIGKEYDVLIDREEGDFYVGRTEADSPEVDNEVLITKKKVALETGNFYKIKITSSKEYDLFGEVISY
ncbi:MAG: 30S ribosomal protein S12 methylthiotransferase RimO [Bacteroidales bacterium]|nr:30S ribosomal protein S12 methylthiotransferase RimO [Bacteroidales bacterium]